MWHLCSTIVKSKNDELLIDVLDFTKDSGYKHLRPRGEIVVRIDEKLKMPVVILNFDE